jgi:uncharacterized protein (DUF2062 family)
MLIKDRVQQIEGAAAAHVSALEPATEAGPGFWRRRVGEPLVSLLAQGLTPDKLALSLAVGLVLGLFPIIGVTTLLCLAAGFVFRLNHVALQLANQLAYPLQLPLVLVFVRLGERLVGAPRVPFDPHALARHFQRDAAGFLREFGLTGLHGILGWSLVAPVLLAVAFYALRPLVRRLAAALRRSGRLPALSA